MSASVADQAEMDRVRRALERRRDGTPLTKADVQAIRDYELRRESSAWWSRARRLPQVDLATLLNCNREQMQRYKADGLTYTQDGQHVYYDLGSVIAWLKRRWSGASGQGEDTSKRAAEIKLLIRREAALQLKMQIMSGQLRDRGDVERENCAKMVMFRSGLEALKRSLAPAVLELADTATLEDAEELIWDYVEPLLRAFAGDRRYLRHPDSRPERGRAAGDPAAGEAAAK